MSLTMMFLLIFATLTLAKAEVVSTPSGSVEGTEGVSRDGRKYNAFYGIPFAEPPVENLRFKNPIPIKDWEGVKNCTQPAPPCSQALYYSPQTRNSVLGDEDCLFLNIFVPKVNIISCKNGPNIWAGKIKLDEPLPVLFHVHGGGFMEGMPVGPGEADYFMDEDVVLVSIQYRVGVLGFLSLENEILSGNFGFKDQALALAWVKSNIASFGGNPEKIVVFGQSAGGVSVHYLMKSPLTKHMINGAISESGVVAPTWTIAPKNTAKDIALKVADMVGCAGSSEEILICLQKVDLEKLIKTKNSLYVWDFSPLTPIKPVVESEGSPGAFITEDPLTVNSNIPWITGVASGEGLIIPASVTSQSPTLLDEFITNIDTYLLHVICVENLNSTASKETAKLIKEKYFQNLDRDSVLNGLKELASDGLFVVPMVNAVKRHNGRKYVYLYDYRGGSTLIEMFGELPKDLGVSHADEMLLLFNEKSYYPKEKEGERQVSKNLVKMWANFARDGTPSSDWKEWKNGEYLLIKETNSMKKGLDEETMKFWNNLPLYKKLAKDEL